MGCEPTVKENVTGGCGEVEDAAGRSLLGEGCCGGGESVDNVGLAVVENFPPDARPAFALAPKKTVVVFVVAKGVGNSEALAVVGMED